MQELRWGECAIIFSYGVGRSLGLPHRIATLVACGNSICGNAATAAVSTVTGAEEISSSIPFTAVLGVVVVLILPPLARMWHLSGLQYGSNYHAMPQGATGRGAAWFDRCANGNAGKSWWAY